MSDIRELIDKLQSPKSSARYDACEALRVESTVPLEALVALRVASQDSAPDVADAAIRALAVRGEAPPKPVSEPVGPSLQTAPFEAASDSSPDAEIARKEAAVQARFNRGINWLFWTAGLSILASIITLAGGTWSFFVGLAVTQLVDGFMLGIGQSSNAGLLYRLVGFTIDLAVAGVFIATGVLGRRRNRPAVLVAMGLYTLDAILFILFGGWLGALWHAAVL